MASKEELSKLLWDSREGIEMYADHLSSHGVPDRRLRELVERIDTYRVGQGWNLSGFGGER